MTTTEWGVRWWDGKVDVWSEAVARAIVEGWDRTDQWVRDNEHREPGTRATLVKRQVTEWEAVR